MDYRVATLNVTQQTVKDCWQYNAAGIITVLTVGLPVRMCKDTRMWRCMTAAQPM